MQGLISCVRQVLQIAVTILRWEFLVKWAHAECMPEQTSQQLDGGAAVCSGRHGLLDGNFG
jgi:hypothetical protein